MTSSIAYRVASALLLVVLCSSGVPAFAGENLDCRTAVASVTELWPPNHEMVPITITGIVGATSITVTGVTQDEPVNGTGDGDTCPDAEISRAGVSLRAERSGNGNGRVRGLRVLKAGFRHGDNAPMALVELVDRPDSDAAPVDTE